MSPVKRHSSRKTVTVKEMMDKLEAAQALVYLNSKKGKSLFGAKRLSKRRSSKRRSSKRRSSKRRSSKKRMTRRR